MSLSDMSLNLHSVGLGMYCTSLILHSKESQNKGQSPSFPCAVCFSVGGIEGAIFIE